MYNYNYEVMSWQLVRLLDICFNGMFKKVDIFVAKIFKVKLACQKLVCPQKIDLCIKVGEDHDQQKSRTYG